MYGRSGAAGRLAAQCHNEAVDQGRGSVPVALPGGGGGLHALGAGTDRTGMSEPRDAAGVPGRRRAVPGPRGRGRRSVPAAGDVDPRYQLDSIVFAPRVTEAYRPRPPTARTREALRAGPDPLRVGVDSLSVAVFATSPRADDGGPGAGGERRPAHALLGPGQGFPERGLGRAARRTGCRRARAVPDHRLSCGHGGLRCSIARVPLWWSPRARREASIARTVRADPALERRHVRGGRVAGRRRRGGAPERGGRGKGSVVALRGGGGAGGFRRSGAYLGILPQARAVASCWMYAASVIPSGWTPESGAPVEHARSRSGRLLGAALVAWAAIAACRSTAGRRSPMRSRRTGGWRSTLCVCAIRRTGRGGTHAWHHDRDRGGGRRRLGLRGGKLRCGPDA